MNSPDTSARTRAAVSLLALSTALSGCYYYAPYGYVPYGEAPPIGPTQQYPFTISDAVAAGTVSDVTASTNTYVAAAAPVFVEPAYYPVGYPYYAWPWWGPSLSLSFSYWGGCCYGGGHHGHWGRWGHGGWGHGGGWAGQGGWTGHGYRWRGSGGGWGGGSGGHYWGGGARHVPAH